MPAAAATAQSATFSHAGMQKLTFFGNSVLASDIRLLAVIAATSLLGSAKLAKFLIQTNFSAQFLDHNFGIYGIVNKSYARYVIRNHIIGIHKVKQCAANTVALIVRQLPVVIACQIN